MVRGLTPIARAMDTLVRPAAASSSTCISRPVRSVTPPGSTATAATARCRAAERRSALVTGAATDLSTALSSWPNSRPDRLSAMPITSPSRGPGTVNASWSSVGT